MKELTTIIPLELRALRQVFLAEGFDIRLVGGCVRDLLFGVDPKDIDLCTDATPDDQIRLYSQCNIRFYPTGLKHGTITLMINGVPYEVTSLRTESAHDGRHAVVSYTRDWNDDLARRDLTINAMAMTFDGILIDPFGGQQDLKFGRVKFVGDAGQRMREDYLRILRFVRFYGRFADYQGSLSSKDVTAVRENLKGLEKLPGERVWAELSKIISGPEGPRMMVMMQHLGITHAIKMEWGDQAALERAWKHTRDPVTLMVAHMHPYSAANYGRERLRWSSAEYQLALFLEHWRLDYSSWFGEKQAWNRARYLITNEKAPVAHVQELARLHGQVEIAERLSVWKVPVFPITGFDLKDLVAPGPAVGAAMRELKRAWADSDYTATKESLLTLQEFT